MRQPYNKLAMTNLQAPAKSLVSMNPMRKSLILLEATGDRNKAALLAMTRILGSSKS
jgi:hypothetical protein